MERNGHQGLKLREGAKTALLAKPVRTCQETQEMRETRNLLNLHLLFFLRISAKSWTAFCRDRIAPDLHHPPPSLANCGTAETVEIFRAVGAVLQRLGVTRDALE